MKDFEFICFFDIDDKSCPLKVKIQTEKESVIIPIKKLLFEESYIDEGYKKCIVEFIYQNKLIKQDLPFNFINYR